MTRRVAIAHDWLNGMRGGEKVLEVICELFPEATLFCLFHEPDKLSPTLRAMDTRVSGLNRYAFFRRRYRSLLPLLPRMIERFDLSDHDLVISSSSCVAKGVRPRPGAPHVCYCHSPMRYVWDLYDVYRERASTPTRLAMSFFRKRLQKWDVASASSDRVTHFIANSRNIAAKIERYYDRSAEVINPPVDWDFFRPGAAPPGDYYFICSAMVPYKRLDVAIEACCRMDRHLVLAGSGPDRERLEHQAGGQDRLGGRLVEFTDGWIGDERLRALYCGSRALLFPGEEDFGITPLEAMSCGRPVVALARGGALETVAADRTGVFFEEQTPKAMMAAMARLEGMTLDAEAIREHARGFARPAFKEKMREAIERVAGTAG